MIKKVTVNFPKNMDILRKTTSKVMANILVRKLSLAEIEKLIDILENDSRDIKV